MDRHALVLPHLKLPANLFDHPFTDGHDQPRFLRQPHEFIRQDQAKPGVLPAQQRLEPHYLTIDHIHDRLIVQQQLPAGYRCPQFTFHATALLRDFVHAGVIVLAAVTPLVLGMVHGDIRIAHQKIDVVAILGENGDTDTDRDIEFQRINVERLRDDIHQFFRQFAGRLQYLFV